MSLRFEAPIGFRLHRHFCGVTLTESTKDDMWWDFDSKRWAYADDCKGHYRGSHAPCRTLRAFKRMLRKYPEIRGRCVLVNRYSGPTYGYDVYDE